MYKFTPLSRGRAVVARRAHNPKVAGSSPALATTQDGQVFLLVRFLLESSLPPLNKCINLKIGFKFEVRYVLSFGSMTIPSGNSNF